MSKHSARFIKGTDVVHHLRNTFGKKASDAMMRDLSVLVERRIEQWAKGTHLKKVYTWAPGEDALRLKFGGKRGLAMCWGCHKKNPDVTNVGDRCADCRPKAPAPEVA